MLSYSSRLVSSDILRKSTYICTSRPLQDTSLSVSLDHTNVMLNKIIMQQGDEIGCRQAEPVRVSTFKLVVPQTSPVVSITANANVVAQTELQHQSSS